MPGYCRDYLEAFNLLHSDRPINTDGRIGGIPLQSKKAFLDLHPAFDRREFLAIITGLDHAFIEAVEAVREKRNVGRKN